MGAHLQAGSAHGRAEDRLQQAGQAAQGQEAIRASRTGRGVRPGWTGMVGVLRAGLACAGTGRGAARRQAAARKGRRQVAAGWHGRWTHGNHQEQGAGGTYIRIISSRIACIALKRTYLLKDMLLMMPCGVEWQQSGWLPTHAGDGRNHSRAHDARAGPTS